MGMIQFNPCDQLERPKVQQSPPGLRDRAIILTLTLTGRRRSEVPNLKAGNISFSGGLFYDYLTHGAIHSPHLVLFFSRAVPNPGPCSDWEFHASRYPAKLSCSPGCTATRLTRRSVNRDPLE